MTENAPAAESTGRHGIDAVTAFLLAWLVPGLGHVYVGRRGRGVFFFVLLVGTYLAGLVLSDFRPLDWEKHPFYYSGRFGCGAAVVAGAYAVSPAPRETEDVTLLEPGYLYVCVVGLLNLVIALNVIQPSRARRREDPPEEGAAP